MEVPDHCIKMFLTKFETYPSFVNVGSMISGNELKKLKSKTKLVWVNKTITHNENNEIESFLEYDFKGIMIYIRDNENLTFLTLPDKIQNIELIMSQIKRLKK
jgi:hypothetical protein